MRHVRIRAAAGSYTLGSAPCESNASLPFASSATVSAKISSLTPEQTYHYRVALTTGSGTKYGTDQTYTPHDVVGLTTEAPSDLTETGATLNASLVGDGSPTTNFFRMGPGNELREDHGPAAGRLDRHALGPGGHATVLDDHRPQAIHHLPLPGRWRERRSYQLSGASRVYDARRNSRRTRTVGDRRPLRPRGAARRIQPQWRRHVRPVRIHRLGRLPEQWLDKRPDDRPGRGRKKQGVQDGQRADQRADARHRLPLPSHRHELGRQRRYRGDGEVHTFQFTPSFVDPCPNAHVRQQTGAVLLPTAASYEIVSGSNAGGYDVESDLVPGQAPFGGYPRARSASGNRGAVRSP